MKDKSKFNVDKDGNVWAKIEGGFSISNFDGSPIIEPLPEELSEILLKFIGDNNDNNLS